MLRLFKNAVIRRIAYIVVSLAFAFISNYVFAENRHDYYPDGVGSGSIQYFSTGQAACEYYVSLRQTDYGGGQLFVSYDEPPLSTPTNGHAGNCEYTSFGSAGTRSIHYTVTVDCTPPQIFNSNTGQCETPNPCEDIQGESLFKVPYTGNSSTTSLCLTSCELVISGLSTCLADNQCLAEQVTVSGNTCTQSDELPASPEQECLKKGMSYGSVNGAVVCVKEGTQGSEPLIKTDGSTKTVTDSNGTTVSETETVSNGDGTVTSTTTTTVDGGTPTTQTIQQDKNSFCAENPHASVCKEATDPCEENPTRVGCLDTGDSPTPETLGEIEFDVSSIAPIALPQDMTCPADRTVTIRGRTFNSTNYTTVCQYASAFRPFILIFAWLSAATLVYLAVKDK